MKNLVVRSLSGAVYVALIVACVILGNPWFATLMSVFCALAVVEFENIVAGTPRGFCQWVIRLLDLVTALTICNALYLLYADDIVMSCGLALLVGYTLIRFTCALYDKTSKAFVDAAWSVLAIAYIAIPIAMLNFVYIDNGSNSRLIVLAMFILIWLNDTGAYCVGSALGRHKMFPRLSPKKSWEGFVGGLVCCLGAGAAFHYIINDTYSLMRWIGFGAMVCVFSTWGDLFESLLKRSHGIKDSGNIIPGHGGILDRIDSLLFVAVAAFIYLSF